MISAKGTIFSLYAGNTSFGTYCNNITHLSAWKSQPDLVKFIIVHKVWYTFPNPFNSPTAWMLLPDSVKFLLVPVRFSYGAFSVISMPSSGLNCCLLSRHVTLLLVVTWKQFHEDCEKVVPRILVDHWLSLSDLYHLTDFPSPEVVFSGENCYTVLLWLWYCGLHLLCVLQLLWMVPVGCVFFAMCS